MTRPQHHRLSPDECRAIALDLGKDPKVAKLTQRYATDGNYPVIVVHVKMDRWFSIASFEEYVEVKQYLSDR